MIGFVTDNLQPDLFNVMDSVKINQKLKREKVEEKEREAEAKREAKNKAVGDQIKENRRFITNLFYYPTPVNDNEVLFNLQYDYLINNNSEAWGELMVLSFTVTKRLVRGYMKKHHKRLTEEDQNEKTSEAILYVLRRFDPSYITTLGKKEKRNFLARYPLGQYYCTTNFIETLRYGVKHVFEYQTELEKNTVYINEYYNEEKTPVYGEEKEA